MKEGKGNIPFVSSEAALIKGASRFSHDAMATTFEIFAFSEDEHYAGQAARAAFDELDRLEAELSLFIENSDISRINNLPANQDLPVGLDTFECLKRCAELYEQTGGAFDITIGLLYDCWLGEDRKLLRPSEEQINYAKEHTGIDLIELNETDYTVRLLTNPARIDLGGFGKGYAVDKMAEVLGEWDIDVALIHGGGSSVLALGAPAGMEGWPVTLGNPAEPERTIAKFDLQNCALSGSSLEYGVHIIDARKGKPIEGATAAWACAGDAATADALSTAFMIMSPDEIKAYCVNHPGERGLKVIEEAGKNGKKQKVLCFGQWEDITFVGE